MKKILSFITNNKIAVGSSVIIATLCLGVFVTLGSSLTSIGDDIQTSGDLTVGGDATIKGILDMWGSNITNLRTPTDGSDAVNMNYIDGKFPVPLSSDVDIDTDKDWGDHRITNVAMPIEGKDVVNKDYVEASVGASAGGGCDSYTYTYYNEVHPDCSHKTTCAPGYDGTNHGQRTFNATPTMSGDYTRYLCLVSCTRCP